MKTTRIVILSIIVIFVFSFIPTAQASINIVIVDDHNSDKIGPYTSLAVVNGYPAISYVDDTNDNLRYVRATDASGTTWGTPQLVDTTNVRTQTDLLVIDGRPAIAYFDSTSDFLKYVRASDANGDVWGTPVPVDDSGNADWYLSMVIANGKPAISYIDVTNQALMYVQAADAQGSSWNTPKTVFETDTNDGLGTISMAIVDGRPAIVFYFYDDDSTDQTNEYAKYVRALDADGASWGTPVTIDPVSSWDYSLAVVDGIPAVAYQDLDIDALKFVQAADAQGSAWNTPQIVDSDGVKVGMFASLEIVEGIPTIAYVVNWYGHPDLRYIAAKDETGSDWFEPMKVDSDAGWYLSLTEVEGASGISYYDNAISALKYAHLHPVLQKIYLPVIIK